MPPARKKFTLAHQQKFLQHLREGMRRGATAELLGFSRMSVMNYIEDHPDFEKQVLDAEGEATEHVEEALFQAAVSGNVAACRAWLELRMGPRTTQALQSPHMPPPGPLEPSEGDEESEFFSNVTRMNPRQRRKGA